MRKNVSKQTASDLNKLGIYQVAGGCVGVILVLWSLLNTSSFPGIVILMYLFILSFFGYSIFCGILCINTKKNALRHSLINQLLQLIGFAGFGIAFGYAAGFYIHIGFDLSESFLIDFGAGISKIDFNFNTGPGRLEINLNIVALGLIIWIGRLMKYVKAELEIEKISSIGEIQ